MNPPPAHPPRFEAVVFDQDGTLVDMMEVIYEAFARTVLRYARREVTQAELFAAMGPPEERMLRGLLPEDAFPEALEYFFAHYDRSADRVRLFPGVPEALDRLRAAGVKMGLFTGKGKRGTQWTYDLLGLARWVPSPVTGDDVEKYKPHPEGILKALEAVGVPPERALTVGDSPYDMLAGRAAGTRTGIALWDVPDPARFDDVHADYRFESPADLVQAVVGPDPITPHATE